MKHQRRFPTAGLPRAVGDAAIDQDLQELSQRVQQTEARAGSPFLSVLDPGYAKGDGTDESEALQQALDDSLFVFWPEPDVRYFTSAQLKYRPGHVLFGAGPLGVELKAALGSAILAPSSGSAHAGLRVTGITLNNTSAATAGGAGIDVNGDDALLEHIGLKNLETGITTTGRIVLISPIVQTVTTLLDGTAADDAIVIGDGGVAQFAVGAEGAFSVVLGLLRDAGFFREMAGMVGTESLRLLETLQHEGAELGLFNAAPTTQQTAPAVPGDYSGISTGSAFTGIDNAQAGTVYTHIDDFNALATALDDLVASVSDVNALKQIVEDLRDALTPNGYIAAP